MGTDTIRISFAAPSCTPTRSPAAWTASWWRAPPARRSLDGLTERQHAFRVRSQDGAGNVRTVTRNFAVDLPAPPFRPGVSATWSVDRAWSTASAITAICS